MPAAPGALLFILASLAAAAFIAFAATPLAARFAQRVGAVDRPAAHRWSHRPIPRSGGLAIGTAFVLAGSAAVAVNEVTGVVPRLSVAPSMLLALFGGVAVAALLGFLDDRFELPATRQFVGQVGLGLVAVLGGLSIGAANNPFGAGQVVFEQPFAAAFAVLWIMGLINSINFVDGLDGLSAGIALIASMTLGLISLTTTINQPFVALLCAVLAGSLLGFLPWNFHPARIYIGTTGVWVVGYALGVLAILGTAKIVVALLVLGVPVIDTFWIIVRRLRQRRSPFSSDRTHLHHRLLDLGLTHRAAVLLVYAICAVLALLGLVLTGTDQFYAFLGILLAGGVLLQLAGGYAERAQEALAPETYEDETAAEG